MKLSPYIIELLREKSGNEILLSRDCELLALDVESVTGEHIGVNTVKRLLGFIADEREPRTSTLDIIARYLGFTDWDALRLVDEGSSNSAFDDRDEYLACYMEKGQQVMETLKAKGDELAAAGKEKADDAKAALDAALSDRGSEAVFSTRDALRIMYCLISGCAFASSSVPSLTPSMIS